MGYTWGFYENPNTLIREVVVQSIESSIMSPTLATTATNTLYIGDENDSNYKLEGYAYWSRTFTSPNWINFTDEGDTPTNYAYGSNMDASDFWDLGDTNFKTSTFTWKCTEGIELPYKTAATGYHQGNYKWTGGTDSGYSAGTILKGDTYGETWYLYPTFVINTYKVKFNSNGGSGTMSNQTHTYNSSKALSTNTFTNDNKVFLGWDTNSAGKTIVYTDGQTVTNLTTTNNATINLYAVWGTTQLLKVRNNDTWSNATPYVRVDNEWKEAQTYVRTGDKWVEIGGGVPISGYLIRPNLSYVTGSSSNPKIMQYGETATLTFTAETGLELPDVINVTGATGVWTKSTGTLVLTNPIGNIDFDIKAKLSGYYQVEYLKSTPSSTSSGQSIDTDWHYSSSYTHPITIEAKVMQTSRISGRALFGIQQSGSGGKMYWYNYDSQIQFYIANTAIASISDMSTSVVHDIKYQLNPTKLNVWIDDTQVVTDVTCDTSGIDTTSSLHFFSGVNGTTIEGCSNYRVYSFKIYEGDTLVRDYIPCVRISDGVMGMFDFVTKEFKINTGSDSFTRGPGIDVELPDEYQEVEYIETTGTGEYINTQYYPNEKVQIEFSAYPLAYNNYGYLYGTYPSNAYSACCRYEADGSMALKYWDNWFGKQSIDSAQEGDVFLVDKNIAYKNGSLYASSAAATYTWTSSYYLYLFAMNGGSSASNYGKYRFRYLTINDESLVRKFIPCYRKSDDVVGLYDLAYSVFYTNNGSGAFVAGPDKNLLLTSAANDYENLDYIETTGKEYIDIGYVPNSNTQIEFSALPLDNEDFGYLYCAGVNDSGVGCNYGSGYDMGFMYNISWMGGQPIGEAKSDDIFLADKNIIYKNGEKFAELESMEFVSPYKMYLFAANYGGEPNRLGKYKLKYFKIMENDHIIRDLIPYKRKSDNVIGLYDKAFNKFYPLQTK